MNHHMFICDFFKCSFLSLPSFISFLSLLAEVSFLYYLCLKCCYMLWRYCSPGIAQDGRCYPISTENQRSTGGRVNDFGVLTCQENVFRTNLPPSCSPLILHLKIILLVTTQFSASENNCVMSSVGMEGGLSEDVIIPEF